METIGNITETAIKKYIEEQGDESRKKRPVLFCSEPATRLQHPVFWRRQQSVLIRAQCKPPVELVVVTKLFKSGEKWKENHLFLAL